VDDYPEIPHNALVLVGDGRIALFLRNVGQPLSVKLELVRLLQHETLRNQDIASDRPGRVVSGPGGHIKSGVEDTDWHHLEESRFVHTVADAISRAALGEPGLKVVVVLPPKALGSFREAISPAVRRHVVAEIPKDLAGHPVRDIERHLQGPGAGPK
jgi:protein required for attachment to host cells